MKINTKRIVMTALFAALACVATMSIRIPTPGTNGYIHPGDAIVILSGIILGPVYGALAAGLGSAMSDLLGGYFIYVPITFIIKALIAMLSGYAFKKISHKGKHQFAGVIAGGVIDIILVAGGYGFCEALLYSPAGALTSLPANLTQGCGGLIIAAILFPILSAVPDVKRLIALSH